MANPRDLAEQAFALLQNALSDSEARASDLDEQLKDKRQPKNRLEEQLDVLTHRLEKVDAERVEWEQKAAHLEDVAEAERVKVAQLKKKLAIAEGGPEKLTKKEINFWKAKAESIDTEITEYKNRLAALRRELNERDEAIARLAATKATSAPAAPAEPATGAPDPSLELRRQLEQRDRWLAELRLELHELKAAPTAPLETEAEIEMLRARIRGLEQSLGTAANTRAGVEADLARSQYELADRERALREASAAAERQLATERERILRDTNAAAERDRAILAEREHRLVELSAEVEHLRNDLRTRSDQQRSESMRQAEQATQSEREVEKQRQLLAANDADFRELRAQLSQRETDLHEHRRLLTDREQALADARRQLDAHGSELKEREREVTSLRDTLLASSRELDELRADRRRLEAAATEVQSRLDSAESEVTAAREQIAGLESELKEEREHAESLSELANERRDHMTKLQEQVEEAEERYAEASWKLSKSLHFQRIVKRRRGVVIKILDALRGKIKANTALKAGLDGLRTYKAAAEQNQQKLLQRIDQLKAELADAEDTIKAHQSGTAGKQELATAMARATALEERLNTQAELIQALEADLKTARLGQKAAAASDGDEHHELEQLRKELETKKQVIAKLQDDTDEQQRRLSKLRGSESETVRLKALTEKDRSEIETLQREIAELRQAAAQGGGAGGADVDAKLRERDGSITRLMSTIKEHEATIKKLTESADSWERKYQFLATGSPEAYKNGEK